MMLLEIVSYSDSLWLTFLVFAAINIRIITIAINLYVNLNQ
jgi:hypothetical protein